MAPIDVQVLDPLQIRDRGRKRQDLGPVLLQLDSGRELLASVCRGRLDQLEQAFPRARLRILLLQVQSRLGERTFLHPPTDAVAVEHADRGPAWRRKGKLPRAERAAVLPAV